SNVGVRRVDCLAQRTTTEIGRANTVARIGGRIDYQCRIVINYCSRGCAGTPDGVTGASSDREGHSLVWLEASICSRIDGYRLCCISSAKAYGAARRVKCRRTALCVIGIEGRGPAYCEVYRLHTERCGDI